MKGRNRRGSVCLLVMVVLAMLALTGVASAAPSVTLKTAFVPIGDYPETGDILGAGAAVEAQYTIKGTESTGGVPSQITHVNFYLPAGTVINSAGFVTCPPATLGNIGPSGCPEKSQASPVGTAGVIDPIGGELVKENATLQAFFAPGGGLQFYLNASAPISAQTVVATGSFAAAVAPYGPELNAAVNLIQSVPGAPPLSTESINIKVGAAYDYAGKTVYYGTLPRTCPKGGFPMKSELMFASGETVTTMSTAPCAPERTVLDTTVPGTDGIVSAPSNKTCLSRRDFPIHIQQIRGLTYRQVSVYVNGHRVDVVKRARFTAPVDLRGLPKGRYIVRITVTTTTGQRITGTRAYHTCAPKPLPGGNPRL